MQVSAELSQKLSKAKTAFLKQDHGRGLAATVFMLDWQFSACGTAYTNYTQVHIDPEFFEKLTEGQAMFLVAHEVWHVLLKHEVRVLKYPVHLWELFNQAADHVINLRLKADGFELIDQIKLCCNPDYTGMSTEQVMNLLIEKYGDNPPSSGSMGDVNGNPAGNGNGNTPKPPSPQEVAQMEKQLNKVIAQTAQANKLGGYNINGCGELDRIVDGIFNPVLPWNTLLQKYMEAYFPDEYNFGRPNQNMAASGWYVPTLHSEGLGTMGMFVDSSGSVSDEEFSEFRANMDYIIRSFMPEKTIVAEFDTQLRKPTELIHGQTLDNVKFTGYGGTDIEEVMDYIHNNDMVVAVIFTDGYFRTYVPENFKTPVIWVIKGRLSKDFSYPVGQVVYMDKFEGH